MKLREIKGSVDPSWLKWAKANTQKARSNLLDIIEYEDGRPFLHVENMTLRGNNQAFTPPPFQIIVEETLELNNYDFENSVYGNIKAKTVEMNGVEGDMLKAVKAIETIKPEYVLIYSKRGTFSNLLAAVDGQNIAQLEIVITHATPPLTPIASISTWDKMVLIGNSYKAYSDIFELQQLLVDNGLEDIA
ncbi:hypothetical protein RsoM2USA_311 [Ralstonia phage RsoM2USA]|nr:hypothetical protein RsoM2USA_311 [Ralstonia phage RsoM2USA]